MYRKLFVFRFLILSTTVMIVKSKGFGIGRLLKRSQSIDEYKVYPLVFIKTDQGFRLPVDLDYGQKSDSMQGDKRKFRTSKDESEVFFCPATIPSSKKKKKRNTDGLLKRTPSINHEVSHVCIVAKTENQDRKTIDVKCDPESEPVIWESNDITEQNSKKEESKIYKYTFGYKICTKNTPKYATPAVPKAKESTVENPTRIIRFGIYDFLYYKEGKEVIMTIHKIRSRCLLDSKQFEKDRRVVYVDDIYGFDIFDEDFSQRKQLFDEIDANSDYKIQKLIPVNDFPFALWRKTTYHYVNTGLMHAKLQELWDKIGNKVRERIQYEKGALNIYTGAFRIGSKKTPIRRRFHKGYEIPQIWAKFLHYESPINADPRAIVKEMVEDKPASDKDGVEEKTAPPEELEVEHKALVIFANNYLDETILNYIVVNFCPYNFCEKFTGEKNADVNKHVRCCFITKRSLRLFGLSPIFSDVFVINGLVEYPPELLSR